MSTVPLHSNLVEQPHNFTELLDNSVFVTLSLYYSILMERSHNDCQCLFVMSYSILLAFYSILVELYTVKS